MYCSFILLSQLFYYFVYRSILYNIRIIFLFRFYFTNFIIFFTFFIITKHRFSASEVVCQLGVGIMHIVTLNIARYRKPRSVTSSYLYFGMCIIYYSTILCFPIDLLSFVNSNAICDPIMKIAKGKGG